MHVEWADQGLDERPRRNREKRHRREVLRDLAQCASDTLCAYVRTCLSEEVQPPITNTGSMDQGTREGDEATVVR